jgi:hypothetical protein
MRVGLLSRILGILRIKGIKRTKPHVWSRLDPGDPVDPGIKVF